MRIMKTIRGFMGGERLFGGRFNKDPGPSRMYRKQPTLLNFPSHPQHQTEKITTIETGYLGLPLLGKLGKSWNSLSTISEIGVRVTSSLLLGNIHDGRKRSLSRETFLVRKKNLIKRGTS